MVLNSYAGQSRVEQMKRIRESIGRSAKASSRLFGTGGGGASSDGSFNDRSGDNHHHHHYGDTVESSSGILGLAGSKEFLTNPSNHQHTRRNSGNSHLSGVKEKGEATLPARKYLSIVIEADSKI